MRNHVHAEEVLLISIESSARDVGKQEHASHPRHSAANRPVIAALCQATHSEQIGHDCRQRNRQPQQVGFALREERSHG